MTTTQEIISKLKAIPETELFKILAFINQLDQDADDASRLCCPYCKSKLIKKNGSANGIQRYICKNPECHHSFSGRTTSFLRHSRISESTWLKFIDFELSELTLESEAYFLNLSVTTCFRMRHKLYNAITEYVDSNVQLKGTIELDATYRKINFKGFNQDYMPRYSKKRGNTSAYSGISHHKICIATAIDQEDNMVMKIVGLGNESFEKYKSLYPYLKDIKDIIADSKTSIPQVANHFCAKLHKIEVKPNIKRYTTNDGYSLGDINQLHSEVSNVIHRTHGISTKYLQGYLDFITIKKKINYKYYRQDRALALYNLIKDNKSWTGYQITGKVFPISLKEAYFEYRHGLFCEK